MRIILLGTLLLSSMLLLSACDTNNQIAEGGISGTGIAMGRIDALGSIVVNGVEYDTSSAEFIRDGVSVNTQNDFMTGEVVTVVGTVNQDGITGNAERVTFADILEGPITVKAELLGSQLQVMGQTVYKDDLTIFHDFMLISDLNKGDIVEISGFVDAEGGIHASSIRLKNAVDSQLEIKGVISQLNTQQQTFKMGDLSIDYLNAQISETLLIDAQNKSRKIQVIATELNGLVLRARDISILAAVELPSEAEVEIEGFITRFESITDFDINNIPVITTDITIFKDGVTAAELATLPLIEVEGTVDTEGVFAADSVSLQKTEYLPALEANLDSVDQANKTLTLFGNLIKVDSNTVLYDESIKRDPFFAFSDLFDGEYVDVKVQVLDNGDLLALRLAREDQESTISFKGIISSIDVAKGAFGLFNLEMITNTNTLYTGKDKQSIDKATLFTLLEQGVTFVEVEGQIQPDDNRVVVLNSVAIIDLEK